ncbi:MAG: hypothetical protein AB1422_05740 [bacterium]
MKGKKFAEGNKASCKKGKHEEDVKTTPQKERRNGHFNLKCNYSVKRRMMEKDYR